ncbi:hypothetical protein CMO96_01415 [Candidatus Woesebacteria bacterium]|nr:hypothetical protein [Candidatus Woesebacteria bacterium]
MKYFKSSVKNTLIYTLAFSLVLATTPVLAQGPDRVAATLSTPGTERGLVLPPAADNSNVISLGQAVDPQSGKVVEGFAIVHPKKAKGKPDGTPGNGGGGGKGNGGGGGGGGGGDDTSSCYGFLAKDAKWKNVEDWIVNPDNNDGISDASVLSILSGGVDKWEDAADGEVDDGNSVNIVGSGSITGATLVADEVSPDGLNEVYFGSINGGDAIGVTIVWGIFSGKPANRVLVEWDQIYDDEAFDWSDVGAANLMDLENIVVHELGHTMGLGDLYTAECADETMYGYGTEGETKKRDLNAGDIAGISKLY